MKNCRGTTTRHLCGLLVFAILIVVAGIQASAQAGEPVPGFVGSKTCGDCHAAAMAAWQGSHHDWAWRAPTAESVLANPAAGAFVHKGTTTRLSKRADRFFIETDGPDGKPAEYEVHSAVGVDPLQQYLVETAEGRLQALDTAWDVERQGWYHLYPDQDLVAGDGLHWTGPYKNWNARCAECHATGFEKNYEPRRRTYESRQAETGVTCEACHGPGAAHVAWAEDPAAFDGGQWRGVQKSGLTIGFDPDDASREIELCAGCHARREPLGDASPLAGTAFADSYRLALLRENLYHPDGQILDEVYVYGSFLQSKMQARGVRCTNCHEPHSGRLAAEGNAVCTQCHNPEGDPKFPSLPKALYDSASHHFHEDGSEGAQCKNCHMAERFYMVIDGRRDHSFRVPRPDLSVKIGTPNACTDCHEDREAAWAAAKVTAWYPSGRSGKPHFGEVFAAARRGLDQATLTRLVILARDEPLAGIVRATALDHLARAPSAERAEELTVLLSDPDPLVRSAAVASQRGAPPALRVQNLLPLTRDPLRAVRIEAIRNLLDIPFARLPRAVTASLQTALRENQASLNARADFPEVQMVLGGTALTLRDFTAAEAAFATAVSLDPQLTEAWLMVARLQTARNDPAAASETLGAAVAANPDDGILHQALGNALVLAGRYRDALAPFERAADLLPDDPFVAADLGLLLARLGQSGRAQNQLERTLDSIAESPDVLLALTSGYVAAGDRQSAMQTLRRLQQRFPESPQAATARRLLQ